MTGNNREAAEVLLANRLYIYTLLHSVFGRDPDAELLQVLTQNEAGEAFALMSAGEGDSLSKAPVFLREVKGDLADPSFLRELRSEYNHLFFDPSGPAAPAWESVYRGKEEMLFQESTLEVRYCYRRFGLETAAGRFVADDSLALELHFMQHLAERALKALQTDEDGSLKELLQGSKQFLEEHLLYWVPKFLDRMKDAGTALLYPQMSLLLAEFLSRDCALVGELLEMAE